MDELRIDLDSGRAHSVRVAAHPDGGWRVSLHRPVSSRRSVLHAALGRHLRVRFDDDVPLSFPQVGELSRATAWKRLTLSIGEEPSITLAELCCDARGSGCRGNGYVLSPFETRFLADNGFPHPAIAEAKPHRPLRTDLHTHLAGCVSGERLVSIGVDSGVKYPTSLLSEAGIHTEGSGDVAMAQLPAKLLAQLAGRLGIPLDAQVTFLDMERIYRLRSPVTKSLGAFIPLYRQIAADYAAMGVRYAELSFSNVLEAKWLQQIHRHVPSIESEFGVKLRFTAALNRHDDYEWDLDCIDRISALLGSRYLVGVDFMGHETNSTRAFERQLRELAGRVGSLRPGFAIRVHAGENPAHPENVRVAIEATAGSGVQLRIGHGLYGVADETLERLKETGTIVEFNLNSNLALNNIEGSAMVPIRRYLDYGVPVVLGTDGYGIYQSNMTMEMRAAALCGLDDNAFERICETEAAYLSLREASDAALPHADGFDVPSDPLPLHYTTEIAARKRAMTLTREQVLRDRLSSLGVALLDRVALGELARGRRVISFAGAWRRSWDAISPEDRATIARELSAFISTLDPARTLLVTGGTRHGVEGVVQSVARRLGIDTLGAVVRETPPDAIESGGITHAHLVGASLYDKGAGLYLLMKELNGLCLFIGGGMIVNDEIQTAANLRLHYLLMDGPQGASTSQARQQPHRAFRSAEELVRLIRDESSWDAGDDPYWHLGANPTVDMVVTRCEPHTSRFQLLLIRRDVDSPSEGGKWALPGGFQLTTAPRGEVWRADVEAASVAAVRELHEETGLDVNRIGDELLTVGVYEGGGRDPRDTPTAWSRSEVFALHLPADLASATLCGADDACDARWFDLTALPAPLAFDHARIIADGLQALRSAGKLDFAGES